MYAMHAIIAVQVFGWDPKGTIIFKDVVCTENEAPENGGGCFYGYGTGIFNDATVMTGNVALHGGSIRECHLYLWIFVFQGWHCYRPHN